MTVSGQSEGVPVLVPRRGHKSRLLQFNSNYGYLFTIISYLIGVFIFATIVGQVGNVITNRNANRLEFERLLDGAKTYMRHHKVPGGMKRRVLRWYDYSWSRGRIQGGGDINTALGLLPDKLKTELALHVNLSVLKKVTIFQECQPEFLHDLVLKMKAYIFTPGDLICRKGEVAREMFIIADGILDVISETGRVLTTMKAGDFFGEIGILNLDGLNKRTADVRSVGYSELFSLSREDVLTAMKDYPEAQEILQSLGRKRLMEAKNASKMHKAQAKQAKDHDSSGDSDNAGKRIVDKLRSDVKGLKNVLRRSRRGTRSKDPMDKDQEGSGASREKHSILRRMSHVQSSDEYEGGTEVEHSPIGAGLPLLQRLKLLKEKQDREKAEKEKNKSMSSELNEGKKEESVPETGLPFTQKLKLLKQKEIKEVISSGPSVVSSTVRTQLTGIKFDKSLGKTKSGSILKEPLKETPDSTIREEGTKAPKTKESSETGRISLKDRLKLVHPIQVKKNNVPVKSPVKTDVSPCSNFTSETNSKTSSNVPVVEEIEKAVPKIVEDKSEVPRSKDGWKLLKKSSITTSKPQPKPANNSNSQIKVYNKGTYLSKSDTILEKQKTVEKDDEKRSRSISPSYNTKSRRKTLKKTVEDLIKERRRSRSAGSEPKASENDSNSWKFPSQRPEAQPSPEQETSNARQPQHQQTIKKYNSISDLSPEYSGLPFVKKLKILNERQKLEELEKELLVRSVSLDVPERATSKRSPFLVRSQSEACTMDYGSPNGVEPALNSSRKFPSNETKHTSRINSEVLIASPESNETLERRHLKSILKKLSADESTSDEDLGLRGFRRGSPCKKKDSAELKKLMRAPTIEGYAARHKKLTKSVTFDSETLPSSPDSVIEQPTSEEPKAKGFPPKSPTAILTLQLSNLSMIPLVSPKKGEKKEDKDTPKEETILGDSDISPPKKLDDVKEEGREEEPERKEEVGRLRDRSLMLLPSQFDEMAERNFRMLPFINTLDDEFFAQVKNEIWKIFQQILEEIQEKLECQFLNLESEVKRKDEIIAELHLKIRQLQGTGSVETMERFHSFSVESLNTCMSPRGSPAGAENSSRSRETDFRSFSSLDSVPQDTNSINENYSQISNPIPSEEEDLFESKDEVCLLSTGLGTAKRMLKKGLKRSSEPPSDEEMELVELPRIFSSNNYKKKASKAEFQFRRNLSLDETESRHVSSSRKEVKKSEEGRRSMESRLKGSFMNRVAGLQRSFSTAQEKIPDFVALDIDDSSNSSDLESFHDKDWEIQMLVEEMAKKNPDWDSVEDEQTSKIDSDVVVSEDVKQLQEELNNLKQMVCDSDLSRLTGSELDILETIIEAKDQKISQIAKSNSLDDDNNGNWQHKYSGKGIFPSHSENRLKASDQRKKYSFTQKLGQAFSFDFHDMERRQPVSPDRKHRPATLKKQKTISGSSREHQSLYNLWHTSSRLRSRMLRNAKGVGKKSDRSSNTNVRSSLPALGQSSLSQDKTCHVRASLPVLSAQDLRSNFSQRLPSSVTSSEEIHYETEFKQSCDSVFEEPEMPRDTIQEELRHFSSAFAIDQARVNDCHSYNSLNSFIKSVGQKVKQVMSSDADSGRNQVPTISKLCEEQSVLTECEGKPCEDCPGDEGSERAEDSQSSTSQPSLERHPKTDPPDL